MKGSAVVQGLKSLASILHPQLPLSPKESQRLLTALTSSFRQQLDKAHPTQAGGDDARPKTGSGNGVNTGNQYLHSSSAAFADKHLASVLTNPLLTKHDGPKKPKDDYTSARIELQTNPAKDPISLLEEYHEKGAATIPIAVLCLDTFKISLENLPEEKQKRVISEAQAGKRTLLWLWQSKLYETDAFVEDTRLMTAVIPFIIREGFEEYLWDWIQMDMSLGTVVVKRSLRKHVEGRYRWKGHILRRIIDEKLDSSKDRSADDALDAFFRACEMKNRASDMATLPVMQAAITLHRAFTRPTSRSLWRNTDPERYDRFAEIIASVIDSDKPYADLQKAQLDLSHPRSPSSLSALKFLRRLFSPNPPPRSKFALAYFEDPKNEKSRAYYCHFLLATAIDLQDRGLREDADWVISKVRQYFPYQERIEERMQYLRSREGNEVAEDEREVRMLEHVPFPTFV